MFPQGGLVYGTEKLSGGWRELGRDEAGLLGWTRLNVSAGLPSHSHEEVDMRPKS